MKIIHAESTFSLLIAISLFALICLSYLHWQSEQTSQAQLIFQKQQALQIAENQIARQLAGLACQKGFKQNGISFEIERCNSAEIEVRFPKGKVLIRSK